MSERNLDFDSIIERKGTYSLKYDFTSERGKPEDVLPFWVADMDFRQSSYIEDALISQVKHGILGYSETKPQDGYTEAVIGWFKRHHDWEISPSTIVKTPGVVFGIALAISAFTEKGDGVLIQEPVYYPFKETIVANERRTVINELRIDAGGNYHIDFEDFEKKITEENVKLFLLCNPHNPVGRVWSRDELAKLAEICLKHDVLVFSDEIHSDFVYEDGFGNLTGFEDTGKVEHTVFATISKEISDITITGTSPSKTFNIAGLQISNIIIPNGRLRSSYKRKLDAFGYSQVSIAGIVGCEAAYANGDVWYEAMKSYVEENIRFTIDYVNQYIPKVKVIKPQGTYLVWLDFKSLLLNRDSLRFLLMDKAKVWLDHGEIFGESGSGYVRINVACPRKLLEEGLIRIKKGVDTLIFGI